jgi:hypothetical protein
MVSALRRGQTGVITYSGHGTWVPDLDGDEADRRDEAICPVDLWDTGVVTDDRLYEIFSERAYGAKLIFISDSCHSGSVNRMAGPLLYHVVDRKATADGEWDVDNRPVRLVRYLAPSAFLSGEHLASAQAIGRAAVSRSRTSALTFTGCRDIE